MASHTSVTSLNTVILCAYLYSDQPSQSQPLSLSAQHLPMAPQDENDLQKFPSESETFLEFGLKMWLPESFENGAAGVAPFEDVDPQRASDAARIGGNEAAVATYIDAPLSSLTYPFPIAQNLESTQYDGWEDIHEFGAGYDVSTDPALNAFNNDADAIYAEQTASPPLSTPDVEAPPMFLRMTPVDVAHADSATPYTPDEETIALLNEIHPYCYALPPGLVPNPAAPYGEVASYQGTEPSSSFAPSSTAPIYPDFQVTDGGLGVSEYGCHPAPACTFTTPATTPPVSLDANQLPPSSGPIRTGHPHHDAAPYRQVIFSTGGHLLSTCAASGSITLTEIEERMADARSAIRALAPVQCMWDPALCSELVKPEDMYLHIGKAHQVPTSGLPKVVCRWSKNGGGTCGDTVQASSLRKHITSKKHCETRVKCYSCGHVYARLEALKDHLVGRVQTRRQRDNSERK
ncbi:hypothetical protein R3P38DRAFT_1318324 [Favolaschia claudopus]|uniref:C2H2-type domain-containing protein n=1 Tax=Favolaschia claudopus TaxID=2862362 RepID=A0AAW0AV57_9AGAR